MVTINPLTNQPQGQSSGTGTDRVFFHADYFEAVLNVKGFNIADINCNVCPMTIEVQAATETGQQTKGTMMEGHRMSRKFSLPAAIDPHYCTCEIASDSTLVVRARWKR